METTKNYFSSEIERLDHEVKQYRLLQTIREMECSNEFRVHNFVESSYKNEQNKKQPEYLMTKDGFAILVMGFTGKKAMKFKEAYINAFNQMAEFIKSLLTAKLEFPEFTNSIMSAHEEPKHYHFSNEINMINKIVLGMDAKGFKQVNGLEASVQSIRPYLTSEQIKAIEKLQRFDIGLIITQPEFQERKRILTEYFNKLNSIKLLSA